MSCQDGPSCPISPDGSTETDRSPPTVGEICGLSTAHEKRQREINACSSTFVHIARGSTAIAKRGHGSCTCRALTHATSSTTSDRSPPNFVSKLDPVETDPRRRRGEIAEHRDQTPVSIWVQMDDGIVHATCKRGDTWSSARAVRCWLKCHNERNHCHSLPPPIARSGSTPVGLPAISWRKVVMTSSPYGPYAWGDTRVTMGSTTRGQLARVR